MVLVAAEDDSDEVVLMVVPVAVVVDEVLPPPGPSLGDAVVFVFLPLQTANGVCCFFFSSSGLIFRNP